MYPELSAIVNAIAALVLAFLTYKYVALTNKLLESQVNPYIIVTIYHDNDRPSIIQLIIENVGKGTAYDIKFILSRDIPERAFGLSETESKDAKKMEYGPLIDGISALNPGEKRIIDWGQYGGLKKYLGDIPVEIECNFKNQTMKKMSAVKSILDIKSFANTTAHASAVHDVARTLADILRNIEKFVQLFATTQDPNKT